MRTEEEVLSAAKRYLKRKYLETTVSMDVIENTVVNGDGQLRVRCTVKSLGLLKSDWIKTFECKRGKIVTMHAKRI